jgi:hypothetical protein
MGFDLYVAIIYRYRYRSSIFDIYRRKVMNSVNTYTAPNLFFCAVCHEFHVIGEDCPPVFVSTPIHKDQDDGQKKET